MNILPEQLPTVVQKILKIKKNIYHGVLFCKNLGIKKMILIHIHLKRQKNMGNHKQQVFKTFRVAIMKRSCLKDKANNTQLPRQGYN